MPSISDQPLIPSIFLRKKFLFAAGVMLLLAANILTLPAPLSCQQVHAQQNSPPKPSTNLPKATRILDTHIHLYDPARPSSVDWPPEEDKILYAPHLPQDFSRAATPSGVTGALVVEASNRLTDNAWLLELTANEKLYVGVIGYLDFTSKDFAAELTKLVKNKRLVGIRMRTSGPLSVNDRVIENLRILAAHNLTLDFLPHGITLGDCHKIATAVPNLHIVVNHAGAYAADGKRVAPQFVRQLMALARHKNVYCKISGLYEHSAQQPAPKTVAYYRPLLDTLWDTFGEKRLIYGSNWPVTKRSGDYASYLAIVREYFSGKGQAATEAYFWKNGAAAYRLKIE